MPGRTPAAIPRRHPLRAAHRVPRAAPTTRFHRRLIRGAQALPALVSRRQLDQGAHRDPRRGLYPVRSTTPAHGGRGELILGDGIPGRRARGFDGAKKVDGVKRHVLVDSAGVLVAAEVTPASMQDRAAFPRPLRKAKRVAPTITHVWMDKGYTGSTVADSAAKALVHVDVVSGPKPGHGLVVQPRRWVVERTNGWINHCRRPDRHHEVTLAAHEGFPILSQTALLLRRLDRSQFVRHPLGCGPCQSTVPRLPRAASVSPRVSRFSSTPSVRTGSGAIRKSRRRRRDCCCVRWATATL